MCLVWPDVDPNHHMVVVEIDDDEPVASLKDMIKLEYAHKLCDVDASDLNLWKCSIQIGDCLQETLNTVRFHVSDTRVTLLHPASDISEHFSSPLSRKSIHVLVEVPALEDETALAPLPRRSNIGDAREKFDATFPTREPSSQAIPREFLKLQKRDPNIVWSRPPGADSTIPVTLLHPIFRQFVDHCETHQPTRSDNQLVLELMAEMPKFFMSENARATELRDILTTHGIPVYISTVTNGDDYFPSDGAVAVDGHLVAIIEVKREIGSKGAEPYAKVVLYYTHSNRTKAKARDFLKFNFPALLITVFGPQISFSGAVFSTQPILTPTLPLFCHHTDTRMRESLARHFGAFKTAIQSLEKSYKVLKTPSLLKDLDPEFPDPREYCSLETRDTVNFKYICQIDEDKLLFIGVTDNGERICIKFVHRYSQLAHEKCAQMGIAPKVRGFVDIGGGWTMVIMDALDDYGPFDKSTLFEGAKEYLRERLVQLHEAGFVHGDVRGTNIMVRKNGARGLMLVDFDWAGIIGKVCYPINVNTVDLWRPEEVSDGLLIKSEHDIAMLERIFQ